MAREIVGLVRAPLYATVSAALPEQLATVAIFPWCGLARLRLRDAASISDPPLLHRRAVDEQIKTSSGQKQMRYRKNQQRKRKQQERRKRDCHQDGSLLRTQQLGSSLLSQRSGSPFCPAYDEAVEMLAP